MNDVYQELIKWDTSKLFTIFSRDNGIHIQPSRVYDFIIPFLRGHKMENNWTRNEFDAYKQEWIEMMRSIKKKAIAREAKL